MQHKITWCYLCGSPNGTTSDHVPPQNLFPEPRPTNLITVACCELCNKSFSNLDEQFRAFIATAANVSERGKGIMRNKVFGSSFKRSPALKKQMAKGVSLGTLMTRQGPTTVPLITVDREVLNPFFIRVTKGLLATFYHETNYFGHMFVVSQPSQFSAEHPLFKTATSQMEAGERGDGVFRFWHRVEQKKGCAGLWIYQFYDAALFIVRHGTGKAWESLLGDSVPKSAGR
jgi:hypothetical protein